MKETVSQAIKSIRRKYCEKLLNSSNQSPEEERPEQNRKQFSDLCTEIRKEKTVNKHLNYLFFKQSSSQSLLRAFY